MRRSRVATLTAALVAVTVVATVLAIVLLRGDGDGLVVETENGKVRGVAMAGIRSWRDLPFAAPPVGERRWQPPAPASDWDGVRSAGRYGASCLQPAPFVFGAPSLTPAEGTSEDCLNLNVNRPDDDSHDLPVLVWLHGGGFFKGSANGGPPNSVGLVDRGVIVVTVNYRLGRLGFFAHPSLPGTVANYGLLDQIAALTWVRDNIGAFGGDPRRVTVGGVSAGGMSVNALMASPRARGLFSGAITESGLGAERPSTLAQARALGERAFPGKSAEQLRELPASALLSSTFSVFRGDAPIIDDVLPQRVADAFAAGTEAPVPWLIGTTDAEFSDVNFVASGINPVHARAVLGANQHAALLTTYGSAVYEHSVLDDAVFSSPALLLAQAHRQRAATYRYRFAVFPRGSPHGSELNFVFDAAGGGPAGGIADEMADYWAAFIKDGSPEADGLPAWPTAAGSALMSFTALGPRPVAVDPWARRLVTLQGIIGH